MNTYSTAERAAYKAGCLAVERRVAAAMETPFTPENHPAIVKAALDDLWAILGAANQNEAVKRASGLENTISALNDIAVDRQNKIGELCATIDDLKAGSDKEREAWSIERQKFQDAIRAQRESANADFNALSDRLSGAQRRINDLSRTLAATKAMSEHFKKERDTLDSFITAARSDKSNPIFRSGYDAGSKDGKAERDELAARLVGDKFSNKENFGGEWPIQHDGPCKVEECANLGIATTAHLLDELKARAEVGGYSKYRTVDPV